MGASPTAILERSGVGQGSMHHHFASAMGLLLGAHGFGAVTAYGGVAVVLFAAASRAAFTR